MVDATYVSSIVADGSGLHGGRKGEDRENEETVEGWHYR